jgi:peptidoglycan/xylan/chitin deacetylase (PgdA/CDA1 family)
MTFSGTKRSTRYSVSVCGLGRWNLQKSGQHEIGIHGWLHEEYPAVNDAAREEQLLRQSIDYLTKATGERPVGFRVPSWAYSSHTLEQVRKANFLYDSSFMSHGRTARTSFRTASRPA